MTQTKNMKLNTNTSIKNLDGDEVTVNRDGERDALTYGDVITNAVLSRRTGDKAKQFSLGTRIYEGGEVDLTDDEVSFIIDALDDDNQYTSLVTGQIIDSLEQ